MDHIQRLQALAAVGHESYASYLREIVDDLAIGQSASANMFGHTPINARASLRQVAKSQNRKYRTMVTGEQTITVIRTQ